ncbi:unnamed protein product [Timema podura]|uniref:Uncharacterized protein n=1 Tax=Timema podura TaxID=61482 RepID=A0ABN7PAQ2_TIMPD|nr:unnamed protein product [Timema podura]
MFEQADKCTQTPDLNKTEVVVTMLSVDSRSKQDRSCSDHVVFRLQTPDLNKTEVVVTILSVFQEDSSALFIPGDSRSSKQDTGFYSQHSSTPSSTSASSGNAVSVRLKE